MYFQPAPARDVAHHSFGSVCRYRRVLDQHLVVTPADLDRIGDGARAMQGGEDHALARGKQRLEPNGCASLALGQDDDDPKAIMLDGVVGDAVPARVPLRPTDQAMRSLI